MISLLIILRFVSRKRQSWCCKTNSLSDLCMKTIADFNIVFAV